MIRRQLIIVLAVTVVGVGWCLAAPPQAQALNPTSPLCTVSGPASGLVGRACSLLDGSGAGGVASSALAALTLSPLVTAAVGAATFVLDQTAHVIAHTSAPQLTSTWFSATYWRVAGIAAVLTMPFLFAAALQALVRSDLSLLLRAALGYLPLSLLAVAIAAPMTMLLLAAADQLSAIVSSAAGRQSAKFLVTGGAMLGSAAIAGSSPFLVFLVALFTVAGAVVLWIELLVREAAVYVIVLLLPLTFAAFVWPARRIWAIRSVELLVALILSKFAIVAVLSLGGAALAHATGSIMSLLAGGVLILLAVFAPWALLRLIPLAEVASAAAGSLNSRHEMGAHWDRAKAWASVGDDWISQIAQMRQAADRPDPADGASAAKANVEANAGTSGEVASGRAPAPAVSHAGGVPARLDSGPEEPPSRREVHSEAELNLEEAADGPRPEDET